MSCGGGCGNPGNVGIPANCCTLNYQNLAALNYIAGFDCYPPGCFPGHPHRPPMSFFPYPGGGPATPGPFNPTPGSTGFGRGPGPGLFLFDGDVQATVMAEVNMSGQMLAGRLLGAMGPY